MNDNFNNDYNDYNYNPYHSPQPEPEYRRVEPEQKPKKCHFVKNVPRAKGVIRP